MICSRCAGVRARGAALAGVRARRAIDGLTAAAAAASAATCCAFLLDLLLLRPRLRSPGRSSEAMSRCSHVDQCAIDRTKTKQRNNNHCTKSLLEYETEKRRVSMSLSRDICLMGEEGS